MEKLESLKQQLNAIYGRANYEQKCPVYIDNRKSKMMEDFIMDFIMDFKTNANANLTDAFAYTVQQEIYKNLMSAPTVTVKSESAETPKEEKWVWVSGYKGLDKDMKAYNDFQYEMDKLYIMPDGEPVEACHGGFHLSLKLEDLYDYKSIGSGNRFFECSALVRESDLEKYGKPDPNYCYGFVFCGAKVDRLAAKSIRLVRELSADEILYHIEGSDEWPEYVKEMAIAESIDAAKKELKIVTMTKMGYARPLAEYIVNDDDDGYKLAVALDSQPGISMDTKVNAIFSHI